MYVLLTLTFLRQVETIKPTDLISLRRVAVPSAQCCARRAMKLSFRLYVNDSAMSTPNQFERLEPVADPPERTYSPAQRICQNVLSIPRRGHSFTPLSHFLNNPCLRRVSNPLAGAPLLHACTYITALHLTKRWNRQWSARKLIIISSTPASDTEDLNDDN
jgi:hypothetical protein